jgi:hypothetical protein
MQLKGNVSKKQMITLNAIRCDRICGTGIKRECEFGCDDCQHYVTNYGYQNTIRKTSQFQKMVINFSVTAATNKKIQATAQMK